MLSIRLFGKFCVERNGKAVAGLDAARVQELFAYLLLHRGRALVRETLASALWSECGADQARKYLRQTLWQLQSALDVTDTTNHVVVAEPDSVRLNPDASVEFDVAAFEQSVGAMRGIPGAELQSSAATLLEHAAELYIGDLLDGWYQDWCLFERERLQNLFMQTLDKLMIYCERRGDYETGVFFGSRLLSFDPAHERTHRRLMRLHYLAGDRSSALRQFHRCTVVLADELDVKPSHRTLMLYEQIRADALDEPSPTETTGETLTSVLERIVDLQASLAELLLTLQQTTTRRDDRPSVATPVRKGATGGDVERMSAPARG